MRLSPEAKNSMQLELQASEREKEQIDIELSIFKPRREWLVEKIAMLQKRLDEETLPPMQILRTKDDALARHRELYGTGATAIPQNFEKPVVREPFVPVKPGPKQKIDEENKAKIRQRYKNAKQGMAKAPRGWAKHVAKEYDVSESLIWNIVYTAEDYVAIPRA